MRADNNWEEKVGKRLFEVEGVPSPQAWGNISRRIAPKPKPKTVWKWLPLLLLFITLPIAFFKSDTLKKEAGKETTLVDKETGKDETESAGNSNADGIGTGSLPVMKPSKIAHSETEDKAKGSMENQGQPEIETSEIVNKGLTNSVTRTTKERKVIVPALVVIKKDEPLEKETFPQEIKSGKVDPKSLLVEVTRKNPALNAVQKDKVENRSNPNQALKDGLPINSIVVTSKTKTTIKPEAEEKLSTLEEKKAVKIIAISKAENSALAAVPELTITEQNKKQEDAGSKPNTAVIAKSDPGLKADSLLANTTLPADTIKVALKKKDKTENKNWSWLIYGSPQYTFQRVFANTTDEVMIVKMLNKNEFESERLGYEVGFRGFYPVKEKLNLEMGFHFARINQHLKFRTAQTKADSVTVHNQNGQVSLSITNREQNEVILFQYFFGGLYAGANLEITKTWSLAGGFGANYLLWKNPDEEKVPIPTTNISPYLSAGLRYKLPISQNLTLQAGPNVQYFLRPVQKESAHYGVKPTTFGFTLGLLFSVKK